MVHTPYRFVSPAGSVHVLVALATSSAALLPVESDLAAQSATVRVEENFRTAPNDVVLAVLAPGIELPVFGRRGGWVEAELEGWVWIRSLQVTDRDGFDLVVLPDEADVEQENLRARPAGPVLARLERGALLTEEERIPGWVRVRRRGWVWSASVAVDGAVPQQVAGGGEVQADTDEATPAEGPVEPHVSRAIRAGPRGMAVLGHPDGDTLGRVQAGTDLEVLDRQGGWARIRLDGWTWMPDTASGASAGPEAAMDGDGEPPSLSVVVADPASWRGRLVTWELRFISLERAEAVRTDFFAGEPFLLTRGIGDADGLFVYVALPPDQLADGEGLTPLERITVVGRVRVGASSLTGSPILDLVELRRAGER